MPLTDRHGRPLRNLRISVTDRCNLRCAYCMPEEEYVWLPRSDLLSFEEIDRLVGVFAGLGVRRVRLTGGEPLLRRDLPALVERLARRPELEDVALTTNGVRLPGLADDLHAAGLDRVTVSLDTLDPARFLALTRRDWHAKVLAGLEAAARTWPGRTKLNTVVMRGTNDDELEGLLALGRRLGVEVRFIEYMDVGGATRWSRDTVVPEDEVRARLGPLEPVAGRGSAPAARYRLPDGTTFGLIASTTAPFCGSCDRSRLTADGQWLLCLYARTGLDLRAPLRSGADDAALADILGAAWTGRAERGAEERLGLVQRLPLAAAAELRDHPHLEMHTRGG